MNDIVRTFKYLKPYWNLVVFSVLLVVAGSAIGLLTPWPWQFLIDAVFTESATHESSIVTFLVATFGEWARKPGSLIVLAVTASLLVTALNQGMSVLDNYVHTRLDLKIALDFRSELFQHVLRFSLARHEQRSSGMLIYIVNNIGDAAAQMIMVVPGLAQSILTLIGMIWITASLDWQLALLSMIVIPFLYYSVGYYVKHVQQRLYDVKNLEGQSLSIIHEALSMIRVIVAFGREGHEQRRFREQSQLAVDARLGVTVRQTMFSLAVETTTALGTALVLGVGAFHVLDRRLTLGELTVILSYVASVYKPLEQISTTVGALQDVFISLRLAYDLLDSPPDIEDSPDAIDVKRVNGDIEFKNVAFSYTGRVDTLKGISFEAKAGQIIGIVGPTGAGKTTLISLLPRFYDKNAGDIFLDGNDIRKLTLKSLRQQISIVLQEPLLFSGSIRDNIAYGRLEASMDEIISAAKSANAHDFIMKLPDQYNTELGERGAKLSGGERQRISVARAFLKNSPILILDEPTSSIDTRTESVILDALDRLMEGRTTFIIAHRLSTIRRADKILVIDQGELIESGSHEELLAKEGLYYRLVNMQNNSAIAESHDGVPVECSDEDQS